MATTILLNDDFIFNKEFVNTKNKNSNRINNNNISLRNYNRNKNFLPIKTNVYNREIVSRIKGRRGKNNPIFSNRSKERAFEKFYDTVLDKIASTKSKSNDKKIKKGTKRPRNETSTKGKRGVRNETSPKGKKRARGGTDPILKSSQEMLSVIRRFERKYGSLKKIRI